MACNSSRTTSTTSLARTRRVDAGSDTCVWASVEADRLASTTDVNTQVTSMEYDPAGNRTAVIDANTHRTEFTFDQVNRVISQVVDPGGLALTTSYAYS